jgi:FSR family fosmidomycin resistance protein-like MFS transporter
MQGMSTAQASESITTSWRQDVNLIGLIGVAHMMSHYSQLMLAPLFPWLKDAFAVSYAELGFLMTLFFTVSCVVQTASGFWVDRMGPRPVLLAGLSLLAISAFGFALSPSYAWLMVFAVVAGTGNGVFHPVDYTLINKQVSAPRLGHAYSAHGISGTLGWAVAPVMLVPLAVAYSWRVALGAAGVLIITVLVLVWFYRHLMIAPSPRAALSTDVQAKGEASSLAFLRIPAVWMCFTFFFIFAMSLSVIQAFAPGAARELHNVPVTLVAVCLTTYMLASASGMVLGGFLATNPERASRVVGAGFAVAASVSLILGLAHLSAWWVPVFFGVMGFVAGTAGPSRDLLVKRATPENASGRVFGVVYSGLDIGQAVSPLIFGLMMDQHNYQGIFLGLAAIQGVLVFTAFKAVSYTHLRAHETN